MISCRYALEESSLGRYISLTFRGQIAEQCLPDEHVEGWTIGPQDITVDDMRLLGLHSDTYNDFRATILLNQYASSRVREFGDPDVDLIIL